MAWGIISRTLQNIDMLVVDICAGAGGVVDVPSEDKGLHGEEQERTFR